MPINGVAVDARTVQQQPVNKRRTTITAPATGTWALGKTIGAGSMGKVKLAKNVDTGEQVRPFAHRPHGPTPVDLARGHVASVNNAPTSANTPLLGRRQDCASPVAGPAPERC